MTTINLDSEPLPQHKSTKDSDEPPPIAVIVIAALLCGAVLATTLTGGIQVVAVVEPTQTRIVTIATVKYITPPPTPSLTPTQTTIPMQIQSVAHYTNTTPTSTPTPSPYGHDGTPAPAPDLYPWANYEWRNYAAHIIAGETESQEARIVIACTLVRDVLQGWSPFTLTTRWYGWKEPSWSDREAIWDALFEQGCAGIPWYTFVGSLEDYRVWQGNGMVAKGQMYDTYGDTIAVE